MFDSALSWFPNIEIKLHNFELFKEKFFSYFWGPAQQKIIKNELFGGEYDPRRGNSYHQYMQYIQLYSNAEYLDTEFIEEHLIGLVMQHFEPNLEEVMSLYKF